jgi:hypothetical protein
LVSALTLAIGYYVPLRKSHDVLLTGLASARGSAEQVNDALAKAEAALKASSSERDRLRAFKADVEQDRAKYADAAERIKTYNHSKLARALSKGWFSVKPLAQGAAVAWHSPRLVTRKHDAVTRTGAQLLCPLVTAASEQGLKRITVRGFASLPEDLTPKTTEEVVIAATPLPANASRLLQAICKVSPTDVSVATSLTAGDAPWLQLEFRDRDDGAGSP